MGCFASRAEKRAAERNNLNYVGLHFQAGPDDKIPYGTKQDQRVIDQAEAKDGDHADETRIGNYVGPNIYLVAALFFDQSRDSLNPPTDGKYDKS